MAVIEVTPAGNQLYEAVVRDRDGETRHQVTVPDPLVQEMDTGDVSMTDVVRAAVEFKAGREGRDNLGPEIDVRELVDRYEELVDLLPRRARELAASRDDTFEPARDEAAPSGDERLLDEVRREQADGQRTPPDERL